MCKMPKVFSTVLGTNGGREKELDLRKLANIQWKYKCP